MDSYSEISTPKSKCRSLGLKRSIQKSAVPKTPLSDVKINYKSLQDIASKSSSPITPCASQRLPQQTSARSTNCCLSLSRRVRDRYKKKRLEFVTPQTEPDPQSLSQQTPPTLEPREDLFKRLADKEGLLTSNEKHQEKVQELRAVINIWKEAFRASLEELSAKAEMEPEDLISQLGIPPDMIEHA